VEIIAPSTAPMAPAPAWTPPTAPPMRPCKLERLPVMLLVIAMVSPWVHAAPARWRRFAIVGSTERADGGSMCCFELSEVELYEGSVNIAPSATASFMVSPTTGTDPNVAISGGLWPSEDYLDWRYAMHRTPYTIQSYRHTPYTIHHTLIHSYTIHSYIHTPYTMHHAPYSSIHHIQAYTVHAYTIH
jgi:hypothetical protein